MGFEYKIIEKLEKTKIVESSLKDIAGNLGFYSQFEMSEIKKVLDKMIAEGKIESVGKNKYSSVVNEKDIKGVLRGNKRGFAFLIREDGGEDLFLPHSRLNGAQHGDTVIAHIVTGDKAKVMSIVERGITRVIGTYQRNKTFGFVAVDDNSYYSDIFIAKGKDMNSATDTKVIVEITKFGLKNPEGRIVEIIGKVGEKQSDVLSILKAYGFDNTFPKEVEEEASRKQYASAGKRKSYVDMLTLSIDGDDSKDLDDAISVFKLGNFYKLYVHIADVSHYVDKDSILDKEAFHRATSVYFPGSVYPMLPPVLSNGLCSLNMGEDRLCLTCEMLIDQNGKVVEKNIDKSIVHNDYAMTYKKVTKILFGDTELRAEYSEVVEMLENSLALSKILAKKRDLRGNINFETKECKIILDAKGNVEKIEPYEYTISNKIIEEFMILANETVAELMCATELPFVYRVHEIPDTEKMGDFKKFVEGCGYSLPKCDIEPIHLQKLLLEVAGSPMETIISKVMLRSMRKARYTVENLGHFGLASEYYCHFTSPIRRYPDLQIHRVIKGWLDNNLGSIPKLATWCEEVSSVSSEREKASEMAERDIDDYYKAEYMQRHIGGTFKGVVSGVTSFGVFVELDNTCEGLARLNNLPADNYEFHENRYLLKGTKHSYCLGQTVSIEVVSCDIDNRRIAFNILEG